MMYWIIALVVYLIGLPIAWHFIKNWTSQTKGEKIYFTAIWPLVLPLYLIHWGHNKQ